MHIFLRNRNVRSGNSISDFDKKSFWFQYCCNNTEMNHQKYYWPTSNLLIQHRRLGVHNAKMHPISYEFVSAIRALIAIVLRWSRYKSIGHESISLSGRVVMKKRVGSQKRRVLGTSCRQGGWGFFVWSISQLGAYPCSLIVYRYSCLACAVVSCLTVASFNTLSKIYCFYLSLATYLVLTLTIRRCLGN